jgi:hypothetical protein
MHEKENTPSDDFIRTIQVLADDETLRKWFVSLKPMADDLRSAVLENMVEEMKANGEDSALVSAIQSLADPAVYAAVLKTLTQLLG